ncbi:hypothetical protein A5661_26245 [Mycobacterium asiaticum]|nr:hypothetical protein A5661_26245 [Mycobacterium asiaticum]
MTGGVAQRSDAEVRGKITAGSDAERSDAEQRRKMSGLAHEPSWFPSIGPRLVTYTRQLGEQTAFYGRSLVNIGEAVRRYPGELLRLIAEMGMGTGALAVIGGTVGIIGFLTLTTGALVAVQGAIIRTFKNADKNPVSASTPILDSVS